MFYETLQIPLALPTPLQHPSLSSGEDFQHVVSSGNPSKSLKDEVQEERLNLTEGLEFEGVSTSGVYMRFGVTISPPLTFVGVSKAGWARSKATSERFLVTQVRSVVMREVDWAGSTLRSSCPCLRSSCPCLSFSPPPPHPRTSALWRPHCHRRALY